MRTIDADAYRAILATHAARFERLSQTTARPIRQRAYDAVLMGVNLAITELDSVPTAEAEIEIMDQPTCPNCGARRCGGPQ